MKSWAKSKKSEWKKLAKTWAALKPPWKPSNERIKIYHEIIKKHVKRKEALLLGATPEIRDLLAKLKMKVTILDISPSMIRAMTSLKKKKNEENIVIGNWLTTKLDKKYNLVIGDSVVNNLSLKQVNRFFQQVKGFLKDDGIFICQIAVIAKPLEKISISTDDIIEKARKRPAYYKSYVNRAYDYCQWSVLHRRNKIINWGELNEIYRHKLKNKEISKKEFKLLDFNLPDVRMLFLTKQEFEKMINPFWNIIEEKYEKEHKVSKDFYRIYILKPR